MGLSVRVDVERPLLRKVIAGLKTLTGMNLGQPVARAIVSTALLPHLRTYPPPSGRPMLFSSDRHRRAFFARLRRGVITVPYRRTYRLRDGWAPVGDGTRVTNAVPYAQYVQGSPGQARYHQGTWKTVETIAAEVSALPVLRVAGIRAIHEVLAERGL